MAVKHWVGMVAVGIATVSPAAPLTFGMGQSWAFTIVDGQPAHAHKVAATTKPKKAEVMVTVRAFMGTSMIATNNSRVAYTFNAELLSGEKATMARVCTLPAGAKPMLEQWEHKADAVRIGNFRAAGTEGRC
jgi:hypothetical protein